MFTQRHISCEFSLLVVGFLLLCGWIVSCAPAMLPKFVGSLGPGQEIVTLNTRPRITVRVLLATPNTTPKGIFVLFPGGQGRLISQRGQLTTGFGQSFQLFVDQGFIAAVVDTPSDQAGELSSHFRTSNEHLEDARKIIDFLGQKWSKPIFLMGHSRGTLSVAHLPRSLKDSRIQGIILTASLAIRSKDGYLSLSELRMDQITLPALFVHHRDDGCPTTPFNVAVQIQNRLTNSPKVNFIEVFGGKPEEDDPCRGWKDHHGFYGLEHEVVKAITDWALGSSVPERIGP